MAITFNDNGLSTLSKLKFGSTSYAIKDAAGRAALVAVEGRLVTAETALTTLNGDVSTDGSILKLIKDNAVNATYDASYTIATKIADLDTRVQAVEAITLDTAMSDTSENGVQNKVIKAYVDAETNRAKGIEQGLDTRLGTAEGEITTLKGDVNTAGSVANSIYNQAGDATFTFAGADSATTIKAAIQANADAIVAAQKGQFKIVDALPETASEADLGYIYLIADENEGYKEWLCINTGTEDAPSYAFEEIGDTHISLAGYATEAWVTANAKDAVYKAADGDIPAVTLAQGIAANTQAVADEASAREQADLAITNDIGAWTDGERSETVRAAIESLEGKVTGQTVKSVNGVAATVDNGGDITVYANQIKMSDAEGAVTVPEAISTVDAKLGEGFDSTNTVKAAITAEATAREQGDTAINNDIGSWTEGGTFATGYTVKSAIEKNATDIGTNRSAIAAIKANTGSALTSLSGGTWEVDATDPETMVWTAISTTDATFLAGSSE